MTTSLRARALIDLISAPNTFVSWDEPIEPWTRDPDYERELVRARAQSNEDESVITGRANVGGHHVALVVSEFAFLGGSIGRDAARRLVSAIERATEEGLPLLAGPASGGTRLQEGTAAFIAMVGISAAIARHKAAGLPYLVYLRNPTTGGVMSSWGSLGHLTVAEPRALLGFLGPRAFEAITGQVLDQEVQVAENLYRRGLIDGVVPPRTLPRVVALALDVLQPPAGERPANEVVIQPSLDASRVVTCSRDPDRPGLRSVLKFAAELVLPLNGTGHGESDHGVLLALARFGGASCVVVGHDRRSGRAGTAFGPAGLRQMQRGISLARELALPLVTMIDTVGAELSRDAEEHGLSAEIAQSLAQLVHLPCPTVSVILGQGAGGGALAFLPADIVLVARNGGLAPLPPEGGAAILWHDAARAPEMARTLGITATDLLERGIADVIIPEYENAADEVEAFCRRVGLHLQEAIGRLSGVDALQRVQARLQKYRP